MLVKRTQSLDKDPRDFALAKKMETFMPSLTNVEAKLVKNMILNKTYPFVRLSPFILAFERRSKAFKWSILLFIIAVSWFVIVKVLTRFKITFLSYIGEVQEMMLMLDSEGSIAPTILLLLSIYGLLHYNKRHYVLHSKRNAFQFYIGSNLIIQSHYHNIYIRLKMLYAASGRPYAHIEMNGYGLEPVALSEIHTADDIVKCLQKLKENIQEVKRSLGTVFPVVEDPFQLAAFDLGSTSRLLPPSFPRAVQLMPISQTIDYLAMICNQVEMMLAIPKTCGIIEVMNYHDEILLGTPPPCLLVRSFLLSFYLPVGTGKVYNKIKVVDLLCEELKSFNSAPSVSNVYKSILSSHKDSKLVFSAFLASAAHVLEGLVTAKCNTRSRQRERLAYLLEELGVLQSEAERTDAVIDTILREKAADKMDVQFTSAIGTWTLYITTRTMIQYLSLGMELELYDIREYCYVFFYMAEVIYPWYTSSLFRAETCLNEMAQLEMRGSGGNKKKSKSKKSASANKAMSIHQNELLEARCYQHLAAGLYKLLTALKHSDLLPIVGDYPYDNERVRYEHRFAPFAAISFPQFMLYDGYVNTVTSKQSDPFQASIEYLEHSCRSFNTAKDILESDQAKHIKDGKQMLMIAKNNLVVTRVIAESLQKEIKKTVKFEFLNHRVFPMVKLT